MGGVLVVYVTFRTNNTDTKLFLFCFSYSLLFFSFFIILLSVFIRIQQANKQRKGHETIRYSTIRHDILRNNTAYLSC